MTADRGHLDAHDVCAMDAGADPADIGMDILEHTDLTTVRPPPSSSPRSAATAPSTALFE